MTLQSEVLEYLKEQQKPLRVHDIACDLDMSKGAAYNRLNKLVKYGFVEMKMIMAYHGKAYREVKHFEAIEV